MKRILATLGVTGLALLGATAPAVAGDDSDDDHKITICHATGSESNPYVQITVAYEALKAHRDHGGDIIPNSWKWEGRNWDEDGEAIYNNGCQPCPEPPVTPEEPPVVTPEEPPVVTPEEPPVVTPEEPPVVTPEPPAVAPPVQKPVGAVVVQAPVAPAPVVVQNRGLNIQTAVASRDFVLAPWAAGVIAMLLAAVTIVGRRFLPALWREPMHRKS
ncbi:hypothetical protein JHV56_15455 [Arthrobacter sp. BHU FT2]|nr:hypothetical protein [Arthrobacter sp. BHU FT2]